MEIFQTIEQTRKKITEWHKQGYSIGFVPTMGYLHKGHRSLIEKSVGENDKTVVSIFVNPTQFAPTEDLSSYPRDLEADLVLCEGAGADLIFNPTPAEMYPQGFCSFVDMDGVKNELCGKSRPTHFRGVCTVVLKLFNIINPDRAYFGKKDAQQLAVIKRMVRDLDMPVEIIGCPLVREDDGLAVSSRNVYLSKTEREAALVLSKAIFEGERLVNAGECNSGKIIEAMRTILDSEPLARIDYVEIADALTIEKIETIDRPAIAAIAVFIGKTRLIDNFFIE